MAQVLLFLDVIRQYEFFQNSRCLKKRREDNVSIRNVVVAVDCNNQCFDGCFVGHQVKAAVPLFPIISKGEV